MVISQVKTIQYTMRYPRVSPSDANRNYLDIIVIQRRNVRFGIGAYRTGRSSVSCARTVPFSTNIPECATGGSTSIVLPPPTITGSTKIYTGSHRTSQIKNSVDNFYYS